MHTGYADSFFKIGSTHEVCQDYCLDSDNRTVALSDGCSSNTHTDFGSRILVKLALPSFLSSLENPVDLIARAKLIAEQLHIEKYDLNATLLTVTTVEEFKVKAWGDGVIVAREKDTGNLFVTELNYKSGAPFYLQYLLDDKQLDAWIVKYSPTISVETYTIKPDGSRVPHMEAEFNLEKFKYCYETTFDYGTYDMVAVLSDGIHSFRKYEISHLGQKLFSPISAEEVIKNLFQFKQTNGVFVKRRCTKFFKDCESKQWDHYDDFSMAAVYHVIKEDKDEF